MCVLFRCFKMKVPRSPLPGKSLEQAWKASEAGGVQGLRRAGGHAAPERSEARAAAAAAGLPAQGGASTGGGSQEPAGLAGQPGPRGQWCRRPTALAGRRDRCSV